jgi:integrase
MPPTRATRYDGVYRSGRTTFKYVLDLDPDPSGKRRQESRGGYRSAEDAHKARTARLAELHRGVNTDPSRQTVSEYLTDWLRARSHSIRPSTQRTYRVLIERAIVPHIGAHLLPKLAPSHIRAWHAAMGKHLAPATAHQAHVVLSMALGDAVDDGALARNVARLVPAPTATASERIVWTLDQAAAFLAAAEGDDWEPLWRVALLTGLRCGELRALTWDDVDLAARTLSVRRTVTVDERGHAMIGPAKSAASIATVELDASCVAALRRQKQRCRELQVAARYWDAGGYVFVRPNGQPLAKTTMQRRLRLLCEAAGVPTGSMHTLRHSCASLMLAQGIDLKTIQTQLRHATLSVTADLYMHVAEGRQRAALEQVAAALGAATQHQQPRSAAE